LSFSPLPAAAPRPLSHPSCPAASTLPLARQQSRMHNSRKSRRRAKPTRAGRRAGRREATPAAAPVDLASAARPPRAALPPLLASADCPHELQLQLFRFFDDRTLVRLVLSCRWFFCLSNQLRLWAARYRHEFPSDRDDEELAWLQWFREQQRQ